MYNLILSVINDFKKSKDYNKLSLFSKVRLADIITLKTYSYDKFKKTKSSNLIEMIDGHIPDFNDDDFKKVYLYPLLGLHVDFLVCLNEENHCVPLLVIELYGDEHNKNSKYADKDRIENDEFKQALFELEDVKIDFMIVENKELAEADKLKEKLRAKLVECLEKRDDAISVKQPT
ncbi:MAG: DUF2726 domain-containing protein [Eubacterium sp.]|nr:DUF2726 domain-containing protein [Eubacterium sp.]